MFKFSIFKHREDDEFLVPGEEYCSFHSDGVLFRIVCHEPTDSGDAEVYDFEPDVQRMLEACRRLYIPALILAQLDCDLYYRSRAGQQSSLESLGKNFEKAVRFYVSAENSRSFLARISEDTDDVELLKGEWIWIIGYYLHGGTNEVRAIGINLCDCIDYLPVSCLDITIEELTSQFGGPSTYYPSQKSDFREFVPPWL